MYSAAMIVAVAMETILVQSQGVLLLLIPLLIVLATFLPYAARGYPLGATLVLLILQTGTLFHPVFAESGGLILESRIIFIGLVSMYVCILILPKVLRQQDRRLFSTAMLLAFLLFYAAGAVIVSGIGSSGLSGLLSPDHLTVHASQVQ